MPTRLLSDLAVDDPLIMDGRYRFGPPDRKYVDDQVRAIQQAFVQAHLKGQLGTYYQLDPASAPVLPGTAVCLAGFATGTVTKATAAALTNAKAVAGIVITGANPGSKVFVAFAGALSPAITGLPRSSPGAVRVHPSTAALEYVSSPSSSDFLVGAIDNAGWLVVSLNTGVATVVGGGGTSAGQVITDADWYIDPVFGVDANDGLTSGTALRTLAGLRANWGVAPRLAPSAGTITIHLLGDLGNSEAEALNQLSDVLYSADVQCIVVGTATTVASGTVNVSNSVDRGYGTARPWQVQDLGVADWTPHVGKRLRVTSGANAGACCNILADVGSHTANVSPPIYPQAYFTMSGAPVASIGATDPYVIEDLSTLSIGMLSPSGEVGLGGTLFAPFYPTLRIRDVRIVSDDIVTVTGVVDTIFEGCRFSVFAILALTLDAESGCEFVGCHFDADSTLFAGGSSGVIGGSTFGAAGTANPSSAPIFGYDFTVYGGTLELDNIGDIHAVGVFNSPANGLTITSGDVRCKTGGHILYGANNTGYGVDITKPDGHFFWDVNTPTIQGTLGDLRLGGKTSARVWNQAAGKYIGDPLALTWANVNATVSAGGFGLFVRDEQQDISICRTAEGGGADAGVVPFVATGVNLDFTFGLETIEHTAAGLASKLPAAPYLNQRLRLVCLDEGTASGGPAGSPAVLDGNGENINGAATYTQTLKSEVLDVVYDGTEWRLVSFGRTATVSTLVGDGGTPNASHITGDVIKWEPTASPGLVVTEISGTLTTVGDGTDTDIALFTAAAGEVYAIDVIVTGRSQAWNPDISALAYASSHRQKLSTVVSKETSAPVIATSELDLLENVGVGGISDISIENPSGADIVLRLPDDGPSSGHNAPRKYTYTVRIQRQLP